MRLSNPVPPSSITDETIERCLANRCDGTEGELVRAYLAVHPGVAQYYQSLRAALSGAAAGIGEQEAEQAYMALMQRIRAEVETGASTPMPHPVRLPETWSRRRHVPTGLFLHVAQYVGVVMLVAVVSVLAIWHGSVLLGVAAAPTTYVTPNGQRANIMLPDGSMVMLNVASRLDVPTDFAAGNRTVQLRGEAQFSVVHHAGVPFTVVTGWATARVLGTSFVVRHYADDTTSMVAVRTGRVAVGPKILTDWQEAEIGRHGEVRVVRINPEDPAQFTFADGVLTLHGVPLRDAVVELDRWYDADIRLGDQALGDNLVQGSFAAGSLTDLAQILGFTFHTRVVREGRVVTLYP